MTLRGSAALSDETSRKRAPTSRAARMVSTVPSTLVRAAATTDTSVIGHVLVRRGVIDDVRPGDEARVHGCPRAG